MRSATLACLALALAAVPACRQEHAPSVVAPPRARVLREIPVFPASTVVDTTGAVDAEQLRFAVRASFDSVTAFYHARLPALRWQFMGGHEDSVQADMLAQRGDTSLWLHIRNAGSRGTEYTLIGSVVRAGAAHADSSR